MTIKRTKISAPLLVAAALLAAGGTAHAAAFAINEQSARGMAMGGAFTGIANDPSAGWYNPAGLATLTGLSMEAGVTMITPGASYTGIAPGTSTEVTVDALRNYFWLPNMHVGYRIHDRVAAGLSVYVPFGLTMEWPLTVDVNGTETPWWGRGLIKMISLETVNINPMIAIKLHDRIFVGGGVSVAMGAVTLERKVTLSSSAADDIDVELSGDDVSVTGNAGVLIKVLPNLLNVGVSFRGGASFTFTGNAAFTKNGSSDAVPTSLRSRLVDGKVEAGIDLPHVITFGVGAFPLESLTIGFAFDVVTWSSYDKLAIDFVDNPELSSSEPKEWNNAVGIRVGAEYDVLPYLPVRVGFIFDQSPTVAHTIGPELPDADRYEFCFGLGYTSSFGVNFDLAYQYIITGDITPAEGAPLLGTYTSDGHLLGLSLGYHMDI
jgi:long-chain fatty acid transport protein